MKKYNCLVWMLLIVSFTCVVAFVWFCFQLKDVINQERSVYIAEIQKEIKTIINIRRDTFFSYLYDCELHIDSLKPKSYNELAEENITAYCGYKLILVDDRGRYHRSDGSLIDDIDLAGKIFICENTLEDKKQTLYSVYNINKPGGYWLGTVDIDKTVIDGDVIEQIALCKSTDDLKGELTGTLFDERGFSCIIHADGRIEFAENSNISYNILNCLKKTDTPPEKIKKLEQDFINGKSGKCIVDMSGEKWAVIYTTDVFDDYVVASVIPLSELSKATSGVVNNTLFIGLILIFSVTVFSVLILSVVSASTRQTVLEFEEKNQELLVANRVTEAKGMLIARMNHDLRTPLNGVLGALRLAKSADSREKQLENIGDAEHSAEYMVSIINDFLDFTKIQNDKMYINPVVFDMYELIDDICKMVKVQISDKSLIFDVFKSDSLQRFYCGDSNRIMQIVTNLLSNAVKFTYTGGIKLFINAENDADDKIHLVSFAVEDTGCGIGEEFLPRIFEIFAQEKEHLKNNTEGTGFGLSIVKNLVQLMNGDIQVKSEVGKGSVFKVTLPLALTDDKVYTSSDEKNIRLDGKRFILAEDNDLNRMMTKEILETEFGAQVDEAANGKQALDKFMNSPKGYYDAMLMDVLMPVLDGREAIKLVRSSDHPDADNIYVVELSANVFSSSEEDLFESGIDYHMSKPIDFEKLAVVLSKI